MINRILKLFGYELIKKQRVFEIYRVEGTGLDIRIKYYEQEEICKVKIIKKMNGYDSHILNKFHHLESVLNSIIESKETNNLTTLELVELLRKSTNQKY